MAQVLPKDETFESPDWLTSSSGATTKSFYWHNFWPGFSPGTQINSSTYSTYPMRDDGPMGGNGASALLKPAPNSLTALPCLMTDTNGMNTENRMRSVICREEVLFNHDDQDVTVTFGIEKVGGASQGYAVSGYSQGSPARGGRFAYPTASSSSGSVFTSMAKGRRGSWPSGGGMNSRGSDSFPMNPWPLWEGNAVYFRVGTGEPTPVNGAIEDAGTLYTKRLWYYSCVNHYAFVAYPNAGSATAPDLYLEVWQVKYTNAGGTSGNVPRRLIQQVVTGGATKIDFRQPYHLRVKVENDGSSNVDINCFIGKYEDANGDIQDEVQCFKTDAIPNGNTFTVGTSVTHTASTGNVKDQHSDKLSTFADRTIGFACPQEGMLDVSAKIGESNPTFYLCHSGVYSVETKDIPSSGSATIRFRDEFERVVEGATRSGASSVVNPLVSQTSVEGVQANGIFTFDAYAQEFPTTLDSSTLNLDMIRRQLLWTTGTSSTAPLDYCLIDYDWDDNGANRPYLVTRSFVHLRPSTQFYNHHRKVEFKPGAEAGLSGISTISYEFGIHLRGEFDGYTTRGLCAYIKWTTNGGAGGSTSITSASVSIVYRNLVYSDQNPENTEEYDRQHLIARKDYPNGTSDGFPNLYDGNWHSLDFQASNYANSPSPEGIGLYNIKLNGSALELNDSTAPYVSDTSSPYTVIEPDPRATYGNAEGFWFLGSIAENQATGRAWSPCAVRNWTEETLVTEPGGTSTDEDAMASVSVTGEGTPTGSLNASSGALAISGAGVWDVDTTVTVENYFGSRYIPFDSGHKYTSPMYRNNRRRWQVSVRAMDSTIYQSLLSFYNSHDGMETPFTFVVPITNDGTETGSTAGDTESVYGWFAEDSLVVTELPGQAYNATFSVEELLVS